MNCCRPEIRCDDVLQVSNLTGHQCQIRGKNHKPLFQFFLEADKLFEKYNYPCTLAILSEGIDVFSEWVEYIKKNQYRYKIELHGKSHKRHNIISYDELKDAKEKIEKTFNVKITTFYPPWGGQGKEVCKKLGIKFNKECGNMGVKVWLRGYRKTGKSPFPQMSFHYWYNDQVKYIERVLEILCSQ